MFACPRMVKFMSSDRPLKSALPSTFPLSFPPLHSISLPHLIHSPIPSNSIPFLFPYPSLPLPITFFQLSFPSCSSPLLSNLPSIPLLSFSPYLFPVLLIFFQLPFNFSPTFSSFSLTFSIPPLHSSHLPHHLPSLLLPPFHPLPSPLCPPTTLLPRGPPPPPSLPSLPPVPSPPLFPLLHSLANDLQSFTWT